MQPPQKILFVIDHFRDPFAGTEGQLFQLVRHLDPELFTPHLLVFTDSDYLGQNGFACDYTVLGAHRLGSPVTWWRLGMLALKFRQSGFRLAHVFFNDASVICPPLFRLFGIRTIISRRDMGYWYSTGLLRVLRLTGRFVSGVLTNSRAVADLTHEKEGIRPERIEVIHNGVVDRSVIKGGEIPELTALRQKQAIIAMVVANIRPIKRIDDAVEAVARLAGGYPQLHLVLVGGGDAESLKALATARGIPDRVLFLGPRDDVPACLGYADIGLLCSESEGFSNSVVEYMQQGIPVICTATGGNPEAVTDGETGILYPVGHVPELAKALEELIGDGGRRSAMGARARDYAARHFSVSEMTERHQRFYHAVLGSDRTQWLEDT